MEKLNFVENRITDYHVNHFKKNGWVNIDLGLDPIFIDKTLLELKLMKKKAKAKKHEFGRVYFDHLFNFNLAAIELPFNELICSELIKVFFSEAKIGSIINSLFGWENPICTLSRLFCMGNFKYRGNWHRDYYPEQMFSYGEENKIGLNIIQIGIYLENQKGFRLLKKDFEQGNLKSIIDDNFTSVNRKIGFPIQPSRESYTCVGGKAGSILIFDPSIYHQGSTQSGRFDFHMRFEKEIKLKSKKNIFQDFSVVDHLHEKFDLKMIEDDRGIPKIKRQSIKVRFFNSLNYIAPVYNLYKILKHRKEIIKLKTFGKPDFFSNSFFQKF
jgi:hypothetical protein